ncbi:DNA internalization-related competence protein ComEC/Rec2 [Halobacillus rhizosphaerae]|uniref:DNA internalization-related competence protein ComEC/Rec2 n=1 Tax=Halobacillus rhizosphaerae TaxID=3064889 RepID=UPI00398B1B1C
MRGKLHLPLIAMILGAMISQSKGVTALALIGISVYWIGKLKNARAGALLLACSVFGYYYFIPSPISSLSKDPVRIIGQITSPIAETPHTLQVRLKKETPSKTTIVLLTYFKSEHENKEFQSYLRKKWRFGAQCTLYSPEELLKEARNPGEFDYRGYMAYQDVEAQVRISEKTSMTCQGVSWVDELYEWRSVMQNKMKATVSSEAYPWMNALMFGEANDLNEETVEWFRNWGISHILAISGLHVGLLSGMIFFILFRSGAVTLEHARFLLFIFLPVYGFIAGGSASVLRAVLMAVFGLLFVNRNLKITGTDLVSLAAFCLLLIAPNQFHQIGFQFSFLVTFALVLSSPVLSQTSNKLHLSSKISVICQLSILPLQIHYFYDFNPLSLFANLLVVPYFSLVVIPLCMLLFLLAFLFSPFAYAASDLFFHLHSLILGCLQKLTDPFLIKWVIGEITPPWILVYYLFFSFMMIAWNHGKLKHAFICATASCVTIGAYASVPYTVDQGRVTMLDIGQGDAFVVELPYRKGVIMIDAAGLPPFMMNPKQTEENIIRPYLKSRGISHLDALMISHHDTDHSGSVNPLVEDFNVDWFIVSPYYIVNSDLNDKVKVLRVNAGDRIKVKGQLFSVLNPEDDAHNPNDNSVVLYTEVGGKSWLFTGDLSTRMEEKVLENYPELHVDVLKVGHHGSKTSTSEKWISQLQPQYGLISAGVNNRYGHPHQQVVDRLKHHSVNLWRTDQSGAVQFNFSGQSGTFSAFLPYNASRD